MTLTLAGPLTLTASAAADRCRWTAAASALMATLL